MQLQLQTKHKRTKVSKTKHVNEKKKLLRNKCIHIKSRDFESSIVHGCVERDEF